MTKNMPSFACLQTLLASENEFNSTGNFNSTETVGDARRLNLAVNWIDQHLSSNIGHVKPTEYVNCLTQPVALDK